MKLAEISIKRPVFTTMMIMAIITYGVYGYIKLAIDMFPNIEFPIITVTTIYRGADPETIETKVTKKIEEAVNQISNIKLISSQSLQNVSNVVIQFDLDKDINIAAQEVRDKITSIQRELPTDLEPPIIQKVDMGAMPVISLGITSEGGISETELYEFADKVIKKQIQIIHGVGNAEIIGGREKTIWIRPEAEKLIAYNLTIDDLVKSLNTQNIDIPAGSLKTSDYEISVKSKGTVENLEQLKNTPVTIINGTVIKIKDVAAVEDSLAEERSRSILNGRKTLSLVITKQPGTNTVEIARKVREIIPYLNKLAPSGVKTEIIYDNAVFIENSINDAIFDLYLGAILAVIIIGVFLRNIRMTIIAAIAIPTSIIGTFAAIKALGFTLNYLTIMGLSLSVGLVVDDAIVVIENIFRHFEKNKNRMEAAYSGTSEIGLAVLATTFSIVAVFLPVAITYGMVGRFMKQFGITVVVAVLISLFVSFTLTPMLSSRFMKLPMRNFFTIGIENALDWLDRSYGKIIGWALSNKKTTLTIALLTLIITFFLGSFLKQEMMPITDQGEFQINVETQAGSSLEYTSKVVEEITEIITKRDDIIFVFSTIGGGRLEKKETASIVVKLKPIKQRKKRQIEIMDEVRNSLSNYDKATISVVQRQSIEIGSSAAMIQLNILGNDLNKLKEIAEKIKLDMIKAGGYTDLDISYKESKPELSLVIDREKAAQMGIFPVMIGSSLRLMLAGDKISEYKEGGNSYDIRIKLDDKSISDTYKLKKLKLRSITQIPVEIGNIVTEKSGVSPQSINRLFGQRVVTIFANLSKKKALGDAVKELNQILKNKLPEGYSYRFTGQADFMKENFKALFESLILGIIMIYFILASQFESFIHPLTIMFSLPFSMIGAIGFLLISGYNLSMTTMIGFIMLMGLVTKNAILLIDFAIRGRANGMPLNEAIINAGTIRLRPILMTTFAMIFGMLPVALSKALGAEIRAPMAISVIGGLITSTLLTLIIVPVIFSYFQTAIERFKGVYRDEVKEH
ncbi:MAG: efflux RND transporter permease subunit [Deltaproteobacteria bacterium]|nr:efflux RND transporter permease subunit [Deltaproteobacteria bacterium]